MKQLMSLQAVFAKSFERHDVEGAKRWINAWFLADQYIPEHEPDPSYGYTQRAMAGHLSDYLEGFLGTEPQSYSGGSGTYMDTKYGSDLYWCIGNPKYKPNN